MHLIMTQQKLLAQIIYNERQLMPVIPISQEMDHIMLTQVFNLLTT